MVKFVPLDVTDEESVGDMLLIIDTSIQFGEDAEVKDNYPDVKVAQSNKVDVLINVLFIGS